MPLKRISNLIGPLDHVHSCAVNFKCTVALWDIYRLEANVRGLESGTNKHFHRVSTFLGFSIFIAVLCLLVCKKIFYVVSYSRFCHSLLASGWSPGAAPCWGRYYRRLHLYHFIAICNLPQSTHSFINNVHIWAHYGRAGSWFRGYRNGNDSQHERRRSKRKNEDQMKISGF